MKIVQSLWSKPAALYGGYPAYLGHWQHPRHFWYSWTISTGWAQRHYGQVELITDHEGAQWLVDKMKLPFSTVRTDLEALNLSGRLWAAGKVLAYSLQDEPFFHIDGDVYLSGRLPPQFESADLVCQFFEQATTYPSFRTIYDRARQMIERSVKNLPSCWKFMTEASAGNCGIFGGCNLSAIKKYTSDVLDMLNDPQNLPVWLELPWTGAASCVIEQQMLWCSAREQGLAITPVFNLSDFGDPEILRAKALDANFNHAAVEGKNTIFGECLARRVEQEFPVQFRIINDLFPRTYANLAMPTVIDDDSENVISQVELIHLPKKKPGS